jgi:pyruvate formate lyase activating enzyme
MNQSKGFVSKIETFATADGPGVRTVIFLSGCTLRCVYCHNPDMWEEKAGTSYSVEELMKVILRMKPYFKDGGGVSFCGGEPLFQSKFLLDMLKACKAEGIHTVLDTAGIGQVSTFDEILEYVDLVLFDIKGIDEIDYERLTQVKPSTSTAFIEACKRVQKPLWIRHVIVPDLNDSVEHVLALANIIKSIPNVEKVELLGFHTMGQSKYSTIRIKDPLEGVKGLDVSILNQLQNVLNEALSN